MKKLIYVLMLLFMINSVSAIGTAPNPDNTVFYYDMENSTIYDTTGQGNSGTDVSTTSTTGIINNSRQFDGSTQYINLPNNIFNADSFSYSVWFKLDQKASTFGSAMALFWAGQTGGDPNRGGLSIEDAGDKVRISQASQGSPLVGTTTINAGTWYHAVMVKNSGTVTLYVNANNEGSNTGYSNYANDDAHIGVGATSPLNIMLDGTVDEVAFFNYTLTQDEVTYLYNTGTPTESQQWNFTEETTTPIIQINNTIIGHSFYNSTFNRYYTNDSILINTTLTNVSTNSNINGTLYVYNGSNDLVLQDKYFTNSLTGNINYSAFPSGEQIYTFNLTYENNETNASEIFYVFFDETKPVIELLTNETEFDVFSANFSNVFNVTDNLSGILNCTINITELSNVSTPDNFFINCDDTQAFNTAGLHNAYVLGEDFAGNTQFFSWNFTVNPLVNISFNDTSNNSIIKSYSAKIYHPDGRVTIPTIDTNGVIQLSPVNDGVLDLGVHNIEFSKAGYATQNFTKNITDTSGGESIVFNTTRSRIDVRIFDRDTKQLITESVNINLIATFGFNGSTTTGIVNISNVSFVSEQYQIIAASTNYFTESIYFTYDNQQIIQQDIYMLKRSDPNNGTINIIVKDQLSNFIESAVVSALEWDASQSAYVSVAECQTNVGGDCTLNIQLNNKAYKFSAVKGSVSKTTNSQILSTAGTTLIIVLEDVELEEVPDLENLLYNFTESVANNVSITRLEWVDSLGTVATGCINSYKITGSYRTLLSSNCTSTDSGILYSINNINNTYDLLVEGLITYDGKTYKLGSFTYKAVGSFSDVLDDYNLDIYIPIVFLLVGIATGIFFGNVYISLALIVILEWFAVGLAPTRISTTIATVVTVFVGLVFWGVSKR